MINPYDLNTIKNTKEEKENPYDLNTIPWCGENEDDY